MTPGEQTTETCQWRVETPDRLDRTLTRRLGLSRREAIDLLSRGGVRIDGRSVGRRDKGLMLGVGQVVEAAGVGALWRHAEPVPWPEASLEIAAQGEGWVVVNKPAGVAVHPLRVEQTRTALNAVVARFPRVVGVGAGGLRSGVVHRLDVGTSGALLLALDDAAYRRFRQHWHAPDSRKAYLALVHGRLEGSGDETMRLRVAQHRPARVAVVEHVGRDAPAGTRRCGLRWRAERSWPNATLLRVELRTGFLHQVRVMLAQLGHPVIGDAVYDADHARRSLRAQRPMLHAAELTVADAHGTCDPPADFADLVTCLRASVT